MGWLLVAALVSGANVLAQPPVTTQKPAAPQATSTPSGDVQDEGFIEFLGSDDVGDAAWWEFLKRVPPRGNTPPAPPPQDAGK